MRSESRSVARGVLAGSLAILFLLTHVSPSHAYIGPGAGFAFVSSFFILTATVGIALLSLLTWPIRWIFRALVSTRKTLRARVKRVIVVGFDGQDPGLTERYMSQGLLPNFVKLRDQGTFARLQTTLPAESPVAWSSFQTGCNPGKHRIYDFLVPNRKSLLPRALLRQCEHGPPKPENRKIPASSGQAHRRRCDARASPSGRCSETRACSATSCGYRSPFRLRNSTGFCFPPCAFRI